MSEGNKTTEEKEKHNATINSQINDLQIKKEAYERVKEKSASNYTELDSLATSASSVGSSLENIVVGGKSLDDGAFKAVNNNFKSMATTFTDIVNVCNSKISEIETKIQSLKTQYW